MKSSIETSLFPKRKILSSQLRRAECLERIGRNPGITTTELANHLNHNRQALQRHTLQALAIEGQIHSNSKDCWYLGKRGTGRCCHE